MRQLAIFVAVTLAFFLMSAAAPAEQPLPAKSFLLPNDPVAFKPGPGSDIAAAFCLICHSAEYVYMQPAHDQVRWAEIVRKMKHFFGCPIPESQIEPLVEYLVSQNTENQGLLVAEMSGVEPGPRADVSQAPGQTVYETHCLNCHGVGGKGDGPIGQALIPPAADLTSKSVGSKSDAALLNTIRQGKAGTAMPAWKGNLSEVQMLAVLAYVRGLRH